MGCKKCSKDSDCNCKRGPRGPRGPPGQNLIGPPSFLIPYASGDQITLTATGSFIPLPQILQFGNSINAAPGPLAFGAAFRAPVDLTTGPLSIAFRITGALTSPFTTLTIKATITVTNFIDAVFREIDLNPIAATTAGNGDIFQVNAITTGALHVPTGWSVFVSLSASATGQGVSTLFIPGTAQGGLILNAA